MLKKIIRIFLRDLKVNTRDFLSLYMIIFPIIAAIGINLLTPGINDTTVSLALIEGENVAQVEYLKDFAKVEVFPDEQSVKRRVSRRDDVIGILPNRDDYYILKQGNENDRTIEYARLLLTFYEKGVQISDTTAKIYDFGKTVPPLKKLLVNIMIMMTSILGGMLITFNIIEEKIDRTIRAIHLSPVSRNSFILGKSIIGMSLPIYGVIAIVLITGFKEINWFQMILMVFVSSIISMLVGFIQGVNNDDFINAAANVKILFLPMAGSIAAAELLSQKWQILFYWIPFYWAYKGNDAVLSYTATWRQIGLYAVIVLVISGLVYAYLVPKIREGLE